MKRFVLFTAVLLACAAASLHAQAPRKVLLEEVTSSTCPPCAATDPFMQKVENDYRDKIVMLKWHVNWPAPGNDPMCVIFPGSVNRSTIYYGNGYAPHLFLGGNTDMGYSGSPIDVQNIETGIDNVAANLSPFTIDISQQIVADSIIVSVTVKSVGPLPTEKDLRLGVVIGERYLLFTGTNGLPAHDFVVRTTVPALVPATGALDTTAQYPTFKVAQGGSITNRYAAKIGSTWQTNQLFAAAFIQSIGTKEVFQSNWTIPTVKIAATGSGLLTIPSASPLAFTLTNTTEAPITLKTNYSGPGIPAAWNITLSGVAADSSITVAANSSATISVNSTAATNQNGYRPFSITFTQPSKFYMGAVSGVAWGKNNMNIVVDAGAGTTKCTTVASAITASGTEYTNTTVVVPAADFEGFFDSWNQFHTVVYNAGATVGLYSDVGDWPKLAAYIAQGGHFLLSSPFAITAYYNSGIDSILQLFRDNFHIEPTPYDNTTPWSSLIGVPADPIGDGINSTVSGMTTTQAISPTDGDGVPCLQDENVNTVGLHYMNAQNGKTVMLTFGLENVKTADRNMVTKRIMDWFDGVSSVKTSDVAADVTITNYPNPVTKSTKFDYSVTDRGIVNLAVYDVLGREVSRVVSNEAEDAGTYSADFDASHLANGSYTYVLTTGSKKVTGTMTVTK